MKLLAMDIGGTSSRVAHCQILSANEYRVANRTQLDTPGTTEDGFRQLLDHINDARPDDFLPVVDYDALAIAIAGPVDGTRAFPPNINWPLDLSRYPDLPRCFLLNDFAAQAYALLHPRHQQALISIRDTRASHGTCAVIGAGTGLGHCLLVPEQQRYRVIPSEAGQAGFVFDKDERDIEAFFHAHYQQGQITNDQVVSGSGLELLNAYFTGETASAASICNNPEQHRATLDQFARFYGRACRQFCLVGCVTEQLIVSGGIAARHPHVVQNPVFVREFDASPSHGPLLEQLAIRLNPDQQLGIEGIIEYSLNRLFSS